jgi:acetylornithine deacetylase/succinyl-diaminopimelate desuccinylase-like protein
MVWLDLHDASLLDEALRILQDLIRINTSNPPGNETPAAQYLAQVLEKDDITPQLLGPQPDRQSLIARVSGDGSLPPLLLVSHLDVVPATQIGWSVDPFAGAFKDGFIWGRGAMDCKYRAVTHAMILKLAKRNRLPLKRDIIIAACADEEAGGRLGMQWLTENHLDLLDAEYVLGEGGGGEVPAPEGKYCAVGVAERGSCDVTITVRGPGGHSYKPKPGNALIKLGRVLRALEDPHLSSQLRPSAAAAIGKLAEDQAVPLKDLILALYNEENRSHVLNDLRACKPDLADWLEPTLYSSLVPTIVSGGSSPHSHPTEVRLHCNLRLLPGHDSTGTYGELMLRFNGIEGVELEIHQETFPSESRFDTELFQTIEDVYHEIRPGVRIVPWLLGGATDVRFLRTPERTVYGFFPSIMDLPFPIWNSITHGVDERISLQNLQFAITTLYRLVEKLCV